jgi:uncharacterized protein (DUF2062 family)
MTKIYLSAYWKLVLLLLAVGSVVAGLTFATLHYNILLWLPVPVKVMCIAWLVLSVPVHFLNDNDNMKGKHHA